MITTPQNGHAFAPTGEHLWRAADGTRLAIYDWKAVAPRGTALIVHGLGEHALRYNHVAAWFVSQGYAVRAYFKPFVHWMWFGAAFMVFGGVVSLSDRRHRVGAPRLAKVDAGTGLKPAV